MEGERSPQTGESTSLPRKFPFVVHLVICNPLALSVPQSSAAHSFRPQYGAVDCTKACHDGLPGDSRKETCGKTCFDSHTISADKKKARQFSATVTANAIPRAPIVTTISRGLSPSFKRTVSSLPGSAVNASNLINSTTVRHVAQYTKRGRCAERVEQVDAKVIQTKRTIELLNKFNNAPSEGQERKRPSV